MFSEVIRMRNKEKALTLDLYANLLMFFMLTSSSRKQKTTDVGFFALMFLFALKSSYIRIDVQRRSSRLDSA